ncbi:hypothetical protein VTN00DRAFT_190 [Thermoascus crustaceus]|uniref:uncharacterized protein n=1 Tax=Thermoascus crustaceus TaxID=5088 RepID=UPI003742B080
MLRYNNVYVRGVGVQSGSGMRIHPGTMLRGAGRVRGGLGRGVLGRSILSASRAPSGTWIRASVGAGARGLATDASTTPPPPPTPAKEQTLNKNWKWDDLIARNRRKKDLRDQADPREAQLLLDIAAAGIAPKYTGKEARTPTVSQKAVEMELKWLQDPRQLADRVARLLKDRQPAMAAALVRRAQKEHMECGVAWNHLMEYCMEKNAPMAAFKFYNEMKKRGRRPSSRTYTIMLNGLSHIGEAKVQGIRPVRTAFSIYKSISAPNSAVERSIIHTNAMLNVCARHGDMETLWEVISDLPEEGPGAPNRMTYTIILQAIRAITQRDVDSMHPSQVDGIIERKAEGVREGKRIWVDVITRWKNGQLEMDHFLVNAMASLLVYGASERDCYDALCLVNQTMGIPIFARKPPDPHPSEQSVYETAKRAPLFYEKNQETQDPYEIPFEKLEEPEEQREHENGELETPEEEVEEEENFDGLFDPVVPADVSKENKNAEVASGPTYLKPDNAELSFILEACRLMTQAVGAGKEYWQHLTLEDQGYKIQPDAHAFHQYLRLLRVGRSSRAALELLRDQMVPAKQVEGKTFHIALSCCRRDRSNINVFNNASGILDLMDKHLVIPDPRAVDDYLDLVEILAGNLQWLMFLNGLNSDEEIKKQKLNSVAHALRYKLRSTALANLRPHIAKLYDAMENGRVVKAHTRSRHIKVNNDGAIIGYTALTAMVKIRAMIDKLLGPEYENLRSKADTELLQQETKKLRRFSDPEMVVKFENTLVYATREQMKEFRAREHEMEQEAEELNEEKEQQDEKEGKQQKEEHMKQEQHEEQKQEEQEEKQRDEQQEEQKKGDNEDRA